jgi:hypothetical protein
LHTPDLLDLQHGLTATQARNDSMLHAGMPRGQTGSENRYEEQPDPSEDFADVYLQSAKALTVSVIRNAIEGRGTLKLREKSRFRFLDTGSGSIGVTRSQSLSPIQPTKHRDGIGSSSPPIRSNGSGRSSLRSELRYGDGERG